MIKKIKKHLASSQGYRYVFIGIINTIVGFSFFPIIYFSLENKISFEYIVILSYLFCILFGFITHKYFTFLNKENFNKQFIKFTLTQSILLTINLLLIQYFERILIDSIFIIQIFLSIGLALFNYLILRKIIFN
jgi:putative flippase GtrA